MGGDFLLKVVAKDGTEEKVTFATFEELKGHLVKLLRVQYGIAYREKAHVIDAISKAIRGNLVDGELRDAEHLLDAICNTWQSCEDGFYDGQNKLIFKAITLPCQIKIGEELIIVKKPYQI